MPQVIQRMKRKKLLTPTWMDINKWRTNPEFDVIGVEATWDKEESCNRTSRVIDIRDDPTHTAQLSCRIEPQKLGNAQTSALRVKVNKKGFGSNLSGRYIGLGKGN